MKINWFKLVASIIVCELAGIIGSFFTIQSIPTWHAALIKPDFSPPNWLFGPVWTILYLLMGLAVYLIWIKVDLKQFNWKNWKKFIALFFFKIQLILNVLWSYLFFGLKNPFYGLIEIVLLWIFILATIISFYRENKTAAYLLIPYLIWVSFAAFLNYNIWLLNI